VTTPSKSTTSVIPIQVSEEELIVKIIGKSAGAVVKIYGDNFSNTGTGFVTTGQHVVSNTRTLLESKGGFRALMADNRIANLELLTFDPTTTIAVFKIKSFEQKKDLISGILSSDAKTSDLTAPAPELKLSANEVAVGQTAIGLGSDGAASVGIISSSFTDATSSMILLKTNAATGDNIGGPLLNIRGEVVGISKEAGVSIAASTIAAILAGIK
jgi:S1-C subfamily serine protease